MSFMKESWYQKFNNVLLMSDMSETGHRSWVLHVTGLCQLSSVRSTAHSSIQMPTPEETRVRKVLSVVRPIRRPMTAPSVPVYLAFVGS